MGMYNEVFDRCPHCGGEGYMQISQVVLGFGGFDLRDLSKIKARFDSGDLSARDLDDLAERIEDEVMRCGDAGRDSKGCGASFRVDESKVMAVKLLSKVEQGDTVERALAHLREAGILR